MPKSKNAEQFFCSVCQKTFSDPYRHLLKTVGGHAFFGFVDKEHREFAEKISKSNCQSFCFCGGEVKSLVTGEDSWEIFCQNCGFIFDED
jgi:hypothetical protein